MKSKSLLFLLFFICFITAAFSQNKEQYMTVIGDSLVGKSINGEMLREVFGHVILTQGNVTITCDKAVQYISRNDAELEGNVIARQENLTITTPKGFYYGNDRRAESNAGLILNDQKVILKADTGSYYFNEDRAWFRSHVNVYDTSTTLTSDTLTYFKAEDRMVATGTVRINQVDNDIYADSLEYIRPSRTTYANNNVKIVGSQNNVTIYGDHLEDYALEFHTIINKNPLLIQIDTTYFRSDSSFTDSLKLGKDFTLDTLIISAQNMESFRDTINTFYAKDSVKIVRGTFASKNDNSVYYRNTGRIVTKKGTPNSAQPVLWNDLTQITGDSVNVILKQNRITDIEIIGTAFLLSQNDIYTNRFDQISGGKIFIRFDSLGIYETEVKGSVLAIYYLYEDSTGNGVTKSSSQNARIVFEAKKVTEVRLYGFPKSEFYPEIQVEGKELSYTLPGYLFITDRPKKESILGSIKVKGLWNE